MLACACREYNSNVGKLRSRRHRRRLITLISLPGFSKESVYLSKLGLGSLIPLPIPPHYHSATRQPAAYQ